MAIAQWMRVLDTVNGLVQMSSRFRRGGEAGADMAPGSGALGQLETRLAGVVVAALKEAFDRDRARMDLERSHMDAERQRAEEALRAELRRQSAERALGQVRVVAIMAIAIWMLSAALLAVLPGMGAIAPKVLMGCGWVLSIAALGCAFSAWQHVSAWSADVQLSAPGPVGLASRAAPWLLLGSVTLIGAALLMAV